MNSNVVDMVSKRTSGERPLKDNGLRIAHMIGGLSIGGAEKLYISLLNEIRADVSLAITTGRQPGGNALAAELTPGILRIDCPVRKRSFPLGVLQLASLLKEHNCNVVHSHMFWASLYGSIAAKIAGVPVVVTTEHGENRWKTGFHRWLERNVISRIADVRFCVSEDILNHRRDRDGIPTRKLQLIANGTAMPACGNTLWQNETPVIGSVGRFVTQKNFEMFIKVIERLRRQGYDVRACIVGDGPEMPLIRRLIDESGLAAFVELPGAVTNPETWFRSFDVYALTSIQEGLPISLLEAMSYGLPVVATDVGAVTQVIRSSDEGKVVPTDDVESCSSSIADYLDNRELAARTGVAARARIAEAYSIESVAREHEQIYLSILESKMACG